jgi:hypothetical protein
LYRLLSPSPFECIALRPLGDALTATTDITELSVELSVLNCLRCIEDGNTLMHYINLSGVWSKAGPSRLHMHALGRVYGGRRRRDQGRFGNCVGRHDSQREERRNNGQNLIHGRLSEAEDFTYLPISNWKKGGSLALELMVARGARRHLLMTLTPRRLFTVPPWI